MRVYIEPVVHETIWDFYAASMRLHLSLELPTVVSKIDALERSLLRLGEFAEVFHREPFREDWKKKGYYEFLCGDFHFAYKIELYREERFVHVYDVVHSLLNHN